jgi:hypothetical protein
MNKIANTISTLTLALTISHPVIASETYFDSQEFANAVVEAFNSFDSSGLDNLQSKVENCYSHIKTSDDIWTCMYMDITGLELMRKSENICAKYNKNCYVANTSFDFFTVNKTLGRCKFFLDQLDFSKEDIINYMTKVNQKIAEIVKLAKLSRLTLLETQLKKQSKRHK